MSLATSLATAQNLLHGKNVAKTAFQRFAAGTLAELCDVYGMSVKGTSRKTEGAKTKSDYIAAIFNFVSYQIVRCLSKPLTKLLQREQVAAQATTESQNDLIRDPSPMLVDLCERVGSGDQVATSPMLVDTQSPCEQFGEGHPAVPAMISR
jgi:hypothetical protein